jgi:hypothetical protein
MCPHNCRGTAESDGLVGSARGNTIYALDGSDRVLGRGDDQLKGGHGTDTVYFTPGVDEVRSCKITGSSR